MANNCNLDKKQVRDLKYLNKDFQGFRRDLVSYAKNYFPDIYNDFNETSPGMMFIEMAAYVGDVMSYYVDNQLKESLIIHAEERENIMKKFQTWLKNTNKILFLASVLVTTLLSSDLNFCTSTRFLSCTDSL